MTQREVNGIVEVQEPSGAWMPLEKVKEVDQLRDEMVEELWQEAKDLQDKICAFKNKAMDTIKSFQDLSLEKYGVKSKTVKGNQQFLSYNGALKIELCVSEFLSFDERLNAAKALIDECIRDWGNGSRPEILALVNDAFKVDKKGKLAVASILRLRRLDISGEKWAKAMEAIGDSVQVQYSKEYVRFYEKQKDEYAILTLDIAKL